MAPVDPKTFNDSEVRLMAAMLQSLPERPKPDWDKVAKILDATNGVAARQRFTALNQKHHLFPIQSISGKTTTPSSATDKARAATIIAAARRSGGRKRPAAGTMKDDQDDDDDDDEVGHHHGNTFSSLACIAFYYKSIY
jgi:hypothetical protein